MVFSSRLDLRPTQTVTQSVVMTPQLVQSIRLLQMTHVELEQFIDSEIEKNPLLERVDTTRLDASNGDFSGTDAEQSDFSQQDNEREDNARGENSDWFETESSRDAENLAATFDASLENLFPDDPGHHDGIAPDLAAQWKSSAGDGYRSGGGYEIDQVTARRISLRDHVHEQISLNLTKPTDRFIAGDLADALDENGYLRADLLEVSARLGVTLEAVEQVLQTLQGFDPAGIFARTLNECLAIQLRGRDRLDPAMSALLDHLELLAKRDFYALQRLCGVDQADLLDMLTEIRLLDPKPGTVFETGMSDAIIPDIIVTQSRVSGVGNLVGWDIELNPAVMPRVLVNNNYFAHVSSSATADEKLFLSDCMQTANWLTRSLDQRAQTILKVAQEIVRQQDGFLQHGISHLKPLNLRMVAAAIGMHESTVSRVTTNKYMLTSRGVFELRYFFSSALGSADGGDIHSAQAVRHVIRKMIEAEHYDGVLSDDALVEALKKTGVDIARRTVAKYREAMHIPSSVQRRREKKAIEAAR